MIATLSVIPSARAMPKKKEAVVQGSVFGTEMFLIASAILWLQV